jgi:hypothetical protein
MGEGGLLQHVVGPGASRDGGRCYIERGRGGDAMSRGTWWLGEAWGG